MQRRTTMTPNNVSSREPSACRGHTSSRCSGASATSLLKSHVVSMPEDQTAEAWDGPLSTTVERADLSPNLSPAKTLPLHGRLLSPNSCPKKFRQTPSTGQPSLGRPHPIAF